MTLHSRPVRQMLVVLAAVTSGLVVAASPAAAGIPPAAPTGLTATFTTGVVTLSWVDNATDETGYSIERCLAADCSTAGQIATVGAGVITYGDPFFTSGATNRYRVRATTAAGPSAYSNVADATLFSTGGLDPIIVATPGSGQSPLTVSFDGSGSTGLNGTVTAWAWSFGDNQTASGAVVSHTFTTPGVYAASLKVTLTGAFAVTTASTSVLITVTAAPPLTAPSDLTATSPSRRLVRLAWTNQATSATTLRVQRCRGAACTSFATIGTLPVTAISYVDTSGFRGVTYRYRLAASSGKNRVYSNRAVVTVHR